MFACIYQPVWADTFAKEHQKSAWMTFLILASPLGVVMGFSMTSVMVQYATWRWSFYIQAFAIVPCVIGIMMMPSRYFKIEGTIHFRKKCAAVVEKKLYK